MPFVLRGAECQVIADKWRPRVQILSSDPDHLFLPIPKPPTYSTAAGASLPREASPRGRVDGCACVCVSVICACAPAHRSGPDHLREDQTIWDTEHE